MIGRITFWNGPKGFGFITVANTDGTAIFQTQYFFHHSNFKDGQPVLAGIVVFNLGEPVAIGKKVQAVGVRFATQAEIDQAYYAHNFGAGADALASGVRS